MAKNIKQVKPVKTISEIITTRRAAEKTREIERNEESEYKADQQSWYVKCFKDFCNATALHGYSYIVQENSQKWER